MAENRERLQVCVLKVKLSCCSKCPIKVKNKLQEIKGVRTVSVDTINGEVPVCGFMDPLELQTALEKRGKRAEILSQEKGKSKKKKEKHRSEDKDGPSQDKRRVRNKSKDQSSSSDSDSDDDADESVNGNAGRYPGRPGHVDPRRMSGRSGPVDPRRMYGRPGRVDPRYARPRMMRGSMAAPPLPPPPPPYWYPQHPVAYGGQMPMHMLRPPPMHPPTPRQRIPLINPYQREAPVGNAFHHKFSDENVNACSIM